jgi:predicted transcriptional regulator
MKNKVWEITVSTTIQIDSEDDYCENEEQAIAIMWDRWNVYKNDLDITEIQEIEYETEEDR